MAIHEILLPFRKYHIPETEKIKEDIRDFVLKINEQILQGKYRLEEHKCLCESEDFDLVASIDRNGFIAPASVCRHCGLVSLNPGFSDIFYQDLYSTEEYFKIFHNKTNAKEYALANFTPIAGRHIINAIKPYIDINKDTRVLEIQAGSGWHLLPFKQAGAYVEGVETNKVLAEWGKKMGFNISNSDIEKFNPEAKYNLLIFTDVLNQVNNPIDYLLKSTNLLNENGFIYIEVPLFKPDNPQLCLKWQYYFTLDTFKYFFAEANLVPLEIKTRQNKIIGIFKRGIYQNSSFLLQRNKDNTYKAIKKLRLKNLFSKKINSRDEILFFRILEQNN